MFNLHQLEIFIKVANAGSFSQAGKDLLMSQSAVSQHMRSLEASMGTKLFKRGARGVSLTDAGVTLDEYANRIFGLITETQQAVLSADGQFSMRLNIGATPGVSVYLLPEWLSTFRNKQKAVAAQVQTDICSVLVEALRRGSLDVAVVEGEVESANHHWLTVQKLFDVEQLVVVGRRHPWCQRKSVNMQDLQDQRFVMRQPDSHTRAWLDELLSRYNIMPKIETVLDNIESIKRAVSIGESITILPPYAVQQEVESGALHTLSVPEEPLTRTIRLLWHHENFATPMVEAFIEHLIKRNEKVGL